MAAAERYANASQEARDEQCTTARYDGLCYATKRNGGQLVGPVGVFANNELQGETTRATGPSTESVEDRRRIMGKAPAKNIDTRTHGAELRRPKTMATRRYGRATVVGMRQTQQAETSRAAREGASHKQ